MNQWDTHSHTRTSHVQNEIVKSVEAKQKWKKKKKKRKIEDCAIGLSTLAARNGENGKRCNENKTVCDTFFSRLFAHFVAVQSAVQSSYHVARIKS